MQPRIVPFAVHDRTRYLRIPFLGASADGQPPDLSYLEDLRGKLMDLVADAVDWIHENFSDPALSKELRGDLGVNDTGLRPALQWSSAAPGARTHSARTFWRGSARRASG